MTAGIMTDSPLVVGEALQRIVDNDLNPISAVNTFASQLKLPQPNIYQTSQDRDAHSGPIFFCICDMTDSRLQSMVRNPRLALKAVGEGSKKKEAKTKAYCNLLDTLKNEFMTSTQKTEQHMLMSMRLSNQPCRWTDTH